MHTHTPWTRMCTTMHIHISTAHTHAKVPYTYVYAHTSCTYTHTIHTDVHKPFTYSVHTYSIMKSNSFSYRNEGAHNTYVALIYTLPSHVSYTRWYLFINICIQKCSWVGSPGWHMNRAGSRLHTYNTTDNGQTVVPIWYHNDEERPQWRITYPLSFAVHLEKYPFPRSALGRRNINALLVLSDMCWSAGNKDIHPNPARKVIQDESKACSSIKAKKLQIHSCSKFEIKNRFVSKVITHICTIGKILWTIAIFEM